MYWQTSDLPTLKYLVPWSNFKPLETETTVANIKRKKFGAARLLHFRSRRTFFFSFLFFTAKVAPSEKITPAAPRCHSCEGVIRLWILSKVLKHFDKRHHKMVRSSSCPSPPTMHSTQGEIFLCFQFPRSVRRADWEVKIRTKYGKKINLGLFIPLNKRVIL